MAAKSRKKIYLMIFGSFPEVSEKDFLNHMPELSIIADVEPVFVFTKDSADSTVEDWQNLALKISEVYAKADGFVVLHQVDNLLYTSSALSFMLQNLSKPIIFTGTQGGSSDKQSGLRANLINASQAINYKLNEVGLMFGNKLLRANQSTKSKDETLNIFASNPEAILGRIDFSIRVFEKMAFKTTGAQKFFDKLNDNVEVLDLSPVIHPKDLAKRFDGKDGIAINARMFHRLPTDLLFVLEKISKDIPIIIWNRRITELNTDAKNIMLINNMTWHSAMTKFMWALTQSKDSKKIKELMSSNIAGEIIK